MHEHQDNRRIDAARAFMESLDQLQNILAQERQTAESESHSSGNSSSINWTDSKLLEDAAADLDAFFGEAQPLEEEMPGEGS